MVAIITKTESGTFTCDGCSWLDVHDYDCPGGGTDFQCLLYHIYLKSYGRNTAARCNQCITEHGIK